MSHETSVIAAGVFAAATLGATASANDRLLDETVGFAGDQPLILQKASGMQGILSYVAFAPNRDAGVFVAINAYDFGAAMAMTEVANDMLSHLAPR